MSKNSIFEEKQINEEYKIKVLNEVKNNIDIYLINGKEETFIGRYGIESYHYFSNLEFDIERNNLIIYYTSYIKEASQMGIIKVLTLYNILDNTFYAMSEKEALMLFNPNLESKYLLDPNNSIVKSDSVKRNKLR